MTCQRTCTLLLLIVSITGSIHAFAPNQKISVRPRLAAAPSGSVLFQSSVGLGAGTSTSSANAATSVITTIEPEPEFDNHDVEQGRDLGVKVLNGLLLAASFGFAAYTILTIDSGMTRGWTSSEIALRIPLDNWLNYENSLADRPIFTKTTINVIIYLLGDWLSQTVFAGKPVLEFDAGRTLRNGFIGLCFGPLVHEYYQFSDHILPVEGGTLNRLQKILMDQTVYLTVKCSIYIAAVGLLQGDSVEEVKDNVQSKLPNIVVTAWKFWPLVHMVTYGVIPARHRILWVNCVDLVWNAILASMSQANTEDEGAELTASESILEVAQDILPAADVLELTHRQHDTLKETVLLKAPEEAKMNLFDHGQEVATNQEDDALLTR